MRVYQTIHKYNPHIPWFEEKYGIHDDSGHSFSELQQLILNDGYASSYILQPAIEGKTDEVFFTIWNYERMQWQWAKEHGLQTTNLQAIKQAQIAWYKPDVFYDFSAMLDKDFLEKYPIDSKIIRVAWFGIIQQVPDEFPGYNWRVSLHRPYIAQWKAKQLPSFELQPAFDERWSQFRSEEKSIDILFYGQFMNRMFQDRNEFMTLLLKQAEKETNLNIRVHLQLQSTRKVRKRIFGFGIPKWHESFPPDYVTQHALPPIYGRELYETIGRSKFVINGYTNFNKDFKSNMRLFESLGCGSLLISERGNYPDGFVEGVHYFPYDIHRPKRTLQLLTQLVTDYPRLFEERKEAIAMIQQRYSKQQQWIQFQKALS
jgi:hypothetical protein